MSIRLSSARRHSMLKRGAAAARLIAIAIAVSLAAALLALTAAMLLIVLALLAVVLAFLAFSKIPGSAHGLACGRHRHQVRLRRRG